MGPTAPSATKSAVANYLFECRTRLEIHQATILCGIRVSAGDAFWRKSLSAMCHLLEVHNEATADTFPYCLSVSLLGTSIDKRSAAQSDSLPPLSGRRLVATFARRALPVSSPLAGRSFKGAGWELAAATIKEREKVTRSCRMAHRAWTSSLYPNWLALWSFRVADEAIPVGSSPSEVTHYCQHVSGSRCRVIQKALCAMLPRLAASTLHGPSANWLRTLRGLRSMVVSTLPLRRCAKTQDGHIRFLPLQPMAFHERALQP